MQSWCRTWPPNGSSRIRAKQKLLREHKGACKSSWSQNRKPKVIYTDNSMTFVKACEDHSWNHCSTPHRSETHGIAERAVRRVKEGTSAVLLQSGLGENWWADSMECYCYLGKVQDFLSDGETPYERRFREPLRKPFIPFGSTVEYHAISAKDKPMLHQLGKKVLPGRFLGHALCAGRIWKEIFWSQTLRSWTIQTRQKSMLGDSMERRSSCRKTVNISYSRLQMEQSSCLEGIRVFGFPP